MNKKRDIGQLLHAAGFGTGTSRSKAKRLYQRFERFRHVVLDFEGVAEIGQSFADELFRVFANTHPGVT